MKVNEFIVLNDFIVSRYTMVILPHHFHDHHYTKVIEEDGEYIVKMKPIEIISRSCYYYGSSLKGRKEGTKEIIGITHKPPIAIEPLNEIYVFPTTSPNDIRCVWISHMHVLEYEPSRGDTTTVYFKNDKSVCLDISYYSFVNQLYRTAQLRTKLSERMEARERKMQYLFRMDQTKDWLS
ncbi:comK family protein [Anoxybacillus sp. B7M1]|jgi:competence protein ComK|uniref:competence protein ComK n=1 Tax=Anoxybacillaceae TaxID=3120669 RepID=UPI0005CD7A8C|nr:MULTISPECIES: competence protein ComK [Anoxybacillus]ANB57782.1 comK family protein [Anoxybacillus sp. B2M1]ANB64033.1 comK family protein [Anoxybacillus sp. B7M1]KXG10096.1 Competence transcription factor [Anoxybacillus sp. P3H1B]MBB3907574.1 competence protein ComK [Anoxybacillus rupiensis]MBS2770561.1 competence protein ComK [Anoxybacillus rupiensis]